MAAPWSVLFSAIHWSDVIAHAPTVAKGAKKLWQKVGKRKAADAPPMPAVDPGASPEARLAALEARVAEAATAAQATGAARAVSVMTTAAIRVGIVDLFIGGSFP